MIFVLGVVVSIASPLRVPASTIPPANAQNITVYHLNPKSAGALPVNMDTGDARGDLYFYLGEFLLPLECANATAHTRAQFDCDNPERVDKNLVVTKVTPIAHHALSPFDTCHDTAQVNLQVDSRLTSYSACNLCNGKVIARAYTHPPILKNASGRAVFALFHSSLFHAKLKLILHPNPTGPLHRPDVYSWNIHL